MDRWQERQPLLRQCLHQMDADVLCFQECLTGALFAAIAVIACAALVPVACNFTQAAEQCMLLRPPEQAARLHVCTSSWAIVYAESFQHAARSF